MNELLGKKVKDKVNGFTGVVTGVAEYSYRSTQILVDGETREDEEKEKWIDRNRLNIIED